VKNNSSNVGTQQTARINWSKIVGKAGNGAKALFEPVMPATFNTVNSTTAILKDIRNATRATKSVTKRQQASRDNSPQNKRSLNLFKSAFDDINSGNFSMDKINNEMFDDYESDTSGSFNMPTGDDAIDMSTEEILLLGNKGVAQSVIQSTSAQLRGLEASSKALINSNIKSTQALGMSINNTLIHGFNTINTTLNIQNQKLDMINRNLSGILQFNNTNAIEYYSKSIDMLSGLGKMIENFEKSMMPDMRKKDRKFDTSGGFNIKEYFNYVKEGIKDSLFGSAAEMAKSVGGNVKDFGIMGILTDFLIPKTLKEPLEKFDKSLTRFFDEGFKQLGDKLSSNPLFAMLGLGDVFGSKREKIKDINLSNYMKNATPWNGIAQKALVEVIPELLTSIDSKLDNSEKRYYDYDRGQFKSKSEIEKAMRNEYFDTFSLSLKDSMDKLTEAVQATGKSSVDQESILTSIQALIDDQISGKKDTMTARQAMASKLKNEGVSDTHIREFIMEFQDGLEGAISRINDLYHDIGSTQHVYRNINNTYGSEYTKSIKKMHDYESRDREGIKRNDYRSFSFAGSMGINAYFESLQNKANIKVDLSLDDDFVNFIIKLAKSGATEAELIREIKKEAAKQNVKDNVSGFGSKSKIFSRAKDIYSKAKGKIDEFGNRVDYYSGKMQDMAFDSVYMGRYGKKSSQPTTSTALVPVGSASTRLSSKTSTTDNKEQKAVEQINALATIDYDAYQKKTESANDRDQKILSNAIAVFQKSPPATTVEESIIKSNNIVFATLSTMLANFKGFTSRLFGKEGFFKKMWDSEARKKATEKLFTGENAIFKKQYDGAKAGLKSLKDKTLGYLGDGYEFLYDNTMQYMYGENYQDNDDWKNNTFLSQKLNRKWRAEQKKKKAEAEAAAKVENEVENGKKAAEDNINNTTSQLLGLPEKSSYVDPRSRADLEKRKAELKKMRIEARLGTSKYSTDESMAFDREYEEIEDRLKKPIETIENNLMVIGEKTEKHVRAAAESTVGDIDKPVETKKKAYKDGFLKKMKATMPKALAGAVAGAGIGLLNNQFSLLGSMFLPGGPIAGAIVGGGLTILSQTEAFKTFMFGKLSDPNDPNSAREGGLISEKMRASFKKVMPFAIGGAVLGGLKGLLKGALGFNSGLGILGTQILPGGILGGALLGAGVSILKNSESFKTMLLGKKGEDGKRSGTIISNSFNKVKSGFSKLMPGIKKAGAGLGIGALSGAVLSSAGYLPAMLSLGGPVGMGIAGLGLGIAASTSKFNAWLFGTEELDENGNVIGRRKDGMLTRVKNILMTNVVQPISDTFKSKMLDLVDWTKEKITYPFRLAFGPILDSLTGIKDNVVDFAKEKFEAIGNGIMDVFRKTTKAIFSPITKAIGWVGKSMIGIASGATKLAMAPASIGLQGIRMLTAGKRRKEYAEFYKNYYAKGNLSGKLREKWDAEEAEGNKRNIFGKISDTIGTYIGHGEIADAAREGWNDEHAADGKNHLNWRGVHQEHRALKANRKARQADEKKWRKIDKFSSTLRDELGGRELTFNDYKFEAIRDKFKRLGIDEKYIQSSDDIMDIIYRKNEFKKKMDPSKSKVSGGMIIEETDEQKRSREKTEDFQDDVLDVLDGIRQDFAGFAREKLDKDNTDSFDKKWRKDKKKLRTKLHGAGIFNVDLNNPEMRDFDINEVDSDRLTDYKYSKYAETGDFIGFMKEFKITQKSKYKSGEETPESSNTDTNHFNLRANGSKIKNGFSNKWGKFKSWIGSKTSKNDIVNNMNNTTSQLLALPAPQRSAKEELFDRQAKLREIMTDGRMATSKYSTEQIENATNEWTLLRGKLKGAGKDITEDQATKILSEMNANIKDLLDVNKEHKEIDSAQLEISTSGEIDDTAVKKRKGKSFGSRIMGKFNAFTSWLGFNKKKSRADAEEAEDEYARKGTGQLLLTGDVDPNAKTEDEEEEKTGGIWGKIKSVGKLIGGSGAGQFILKGMKFAGSIGLLGALGFTVAELIRPGTAKKVGDKIDEFNDYVNSDDFSMKKVMHDFSVKFGTWFDDTVVGEWWNEKISPWWDNKAFPWLKDAVSKVPEIIFEYLPGTIVKAGELIATHAPKIISAFCTVISEIAPPLATAILKSTPEILGAVLKGSWEIVKSLGNELLYALGLKKRPNGDKETISNSSFSTSSDKQAFVDEMKNNSGKASYIDSETGEVVEVSAKSATIDENGNVIIEYNQDKTANTGLITAGSNAIIRGGLNSGRAGIHGKAGRAAVKMPFRAVGVMGGTSLGATGGAVAGTFGGPVGTVSGMATGGFKGAKAGWKAGGKVGDKVSNGVSRFGATYLPDATSEIVSNKSALGNWRMNRQLSKTVTSSTVNVDAGALEKSIKEATDSALAKASSGGGALALKLSTEEASSKVLSESIGASISATLSENGQVASKETMEKAIKESTERLMKETKSETATELAEKLAKKTGTTAIKEAGTEAVEATVKESKKGVIKSLFAKIKGAIDKLSKNEKVMKIIGKFTADSSIIGKFIKGFKEIIEKLATKVFSNEKIWMKLSTKIAGGLAELGLRTTPLAVLFGAYDLINGAFSAKNLFRTTETDWLMCLISALFEFVLGLSPIYLLNIVLEVVQAIMDTDFKCQWASALYKAMAPEDGGFGLLGDKGLEDSQLALEIATAKYNKEHGTNISSTEYNNKVNKGIGGTIWDGFKATSNAIFGTKFETQWNSKQDVTADEIAAYKKEKGLGQGLGYGPKHPAIINGVYAQGDPRWGKMPIGYLPDGSVATMDKAGCGPTALAAAANTVAERNIGYGPITPADMGAYAASNGYISQGGANAGLFTEGAARMGLVSNPINNSYELKDNLLAGKPTILTGRSSSSADPYTQAGHIVMADGIYGNNMSVMDPITGKHKLYDINNVSKNTEHAWAYSAGYGPRPSDKKAVGLTPGKSTNLTGKNTNTSTTSTSTPAKSNVIYVQSDVDESGKPIYDKVIRVRTGTDRKGNPIYTTTTIHSDGSATIKYSNTGTTRYVDDYASNGLIDYGTISGYKTNSSGIDDNILNSNYKYFKDNDTWFTDKYPDDVHGKTSNNIIKYADRTGGTISRVRLGYVLSTQYFGMNGGSYGTIQIIPKKLGNKYTDTYHSLTQDLVAKIYAAAIVSENRKGNTFVSAPLSDAEKFLALCNACRVMYGVGNTLEFTRDSSKFSSYITDINDDDYRKLAREASGLSAEITTPVVEQTGIMNAEQLAEFAKKKKFFGKLKLLGFIAQAKINATLNGTDFWTEFEELTREETNPSASSGAILKGSSTTLTNAINSPNNIQEELLGKTIENIYRGESGGNYATVINDTNNKASVGPYQANAGNAVKLLKNLANASGIPFELKSKFTEYANLINNGKALTKDQMNDLSSALGDEQNKDAIRSSIDATAMKFYHDTFYNPHFAGYYDTGLIKDLRTLPLLADIGNTGPNLITSKTKDNAFMYHWPQEANLTTKDEELAAAYNLLLSRKLYWANSKYASSYTKRIKDTYENLAGYEFKSFVPDPGGLSQYFAKETNPLGFGKPTEGLDKIGDVVINATDNMEKVKTFSTGMNEINKILVGHMGGKMGLDTDAMGLSTSKDKEGGSSEDTGSTPVKSGPKPTSSQNATAFFTNTLNARKTSDYGNRTHPISGEYKFHAGIDYGTSGKSPNIYTPVAGKCVENYYHSGYGNLCVIEADDGTKHYFAHMKNKSPLTIGQYYQAGTCVGVVGTTGSSTGNHLHYEIRNKPWTYKTNNINPDTYNYGSGVVSLGDNKSFDFTKLPADGFGNIPLLSLGYGNAKKTTKIDSPAYREQLRKSIDTQEEFKVTPRDFEAIGFGPGMTVDAGFDMTNTDGKLDKVIGIISEWFAESKKTTGSAQSSATTNNIVSNTTNISQSGGSTPKRVANTSKYKETLANHHMLVASKLNAHNIM